MSLMQVVKQAKSFSVPLADTSQIFDYNRQVSSIQTTTQAIKETRQYEERQRKIEDQYISQAHPCKVSQIKNLQDQLGGLEPQEFKSVILNNFYNPAVMKAAMCIADSIFYTQPIQGGAVSSNQRIREWLRDLKQIGSESVEGFALKANLENADSVFIVKAPRDPQNAELRHELFVGIQLNKLRTSVPNFAYVFGGFKCSPPVIDTTKDVVAWCNNTDVSVHYVMYENIAPAVSFRDYVKTCTFPQWLDKYLQVLYALDAAVKMIDFTHYDLHDENVLVRDIGEKSFSIPYSTERGGTEYLLTDGISTVIDYGFSHVKYDGKDFGVWDKMAWGVLPRRSFPLHDAYKLLLMSMRSMKDYNNVECYNGASQILKFFNSTESADYIVANQAQTYYFLPFTTSTGNTSLFDLTKYIRDNIPVANQIIRSKPGLERVIGCTGTDVCITSSDTVRKVGVSGPLTVDTVFEFYDLVTRLNQEGRSNDIEQVVKSFNYQSAIQIALSNYNKLVTETNEILANMNILSIKGLPVQNLFDIQLLDQYKASASKVAELYDHIQELSLHKDAVKYAAQFYGDTNTSAMLDNQYASIELQLEVVRQGITSIRADQQYLNNLSQTQGQYINQQIANDRRFMWWWKGLSSLSYVFA